MTGLINGQFLTVALKRVPSGVQTKKNFKCNSCGNGLDKILVPYQLKDVAVLPCGMQRGLLFAFSDISILTTSVDELQLRSYCIMGIRHANKDVSWFQAVG